MGKSRRGSKEFTREQKLIQENKRLKRALAKLSKEFARLDLDRGAMVSQMIAEAYQDGQEEAGQDVINMLKKRWSCKECESGHLEIIIFNKISESHYYRKCTACPNRTKSQKYSPQVAGIIKKEAE